ncbi:PP2C family serine/threonine-protein phosphatase [Streptomyces roseicoloratus]|uniref:PP2C family serine/threonine-protein phosphatase n=1 Tax=Streptomyces roseicoloratus TaxID=2508722 RepID=A0ABY9RSI1_9ACTN|nr:PP2C family serine/threonine-protein phosphatase [Streptomyces roseicoloratus]WMX44897.1 PP2C family serine/threonine-protein phosphatase [Streptomyces roseicoloratus]
MRPRGRPSRRWRVHGISSVGYRHLRDSKPCQDAWLHRETPGGLVLAVADGAGSAERSGEGARAAVRLAVDAFAPIAAPWRHGDDPRSRTELMTEAFREVRAEFLNWCAGPASPYATTLTVVVAAEGWLGQASVGDGLVLVRAESHSALAAPDVTGRGAPGAAARAADRVAGGGADGEAGPAAPPPSAAAAPASYHLLPQPPSGSEYANETVFLGSPTALGRLRVDCVRDDRIDGVLLSTDGLTHALLRRSPGGHPLPHDAFVGHLFDRLARADYDHDEEDHRLKDFLASDQISRVTGDDKTLLWAIRHDDH